MNARSSQRRIEAAEVLDAVAAQPITDRVFLLYHPAQQLIQPACQRVGATLRPAATV